MLINCPGCGKELNDKAQACPKCGLDIRQYYDKINQENNDKKVEEDSIKQKCPECSELVDMEEVNCPNCNFPIAQERQKKKNQIKKWTTIIAIFSLIAIIFIVANALKADFIIIFGGDI